MDGYRCTFTQKVTWRDCDMAGHVNNAVYATYFETGRMEYLEAVGGEDAGSMDLILAEITISYRSPAFLRELLEIGVRVTELRNSSFIMESQVIEQKTGRLVATSRAVIVHYDYAAQKAKPVTPEWRERISRFEGREL